MSKKVSTEILRAPKSSLIFSATKRGGKEKKRMSTIEPREVKNKYCLYWNNLLIIHL